MIYDIYHDAITQFFPSYYSPRYDSVSDVHGSAEFGVLLYLWVRLSLRMQ